MPPTIMIAAHDPDISYLLQRYAEESGFQTVSVCQGKDVLELAHNTHPALIILDLELPGVSGEKMLRGLRAEAATSQIPIVLYAGTDELPENDEEGFVGVAGFLPKSVRYDDFVAVLEHTGVHN